MEKIFLPFSGAVRPWLCRGEDRAVVILPDERQVEEFLSDGSVMTPYMRLTRFQELPLEKPALEDIASFSARGYSLSEWQNRGGLLVSTPGGLLTPVVDPGVRLSLEVGARFERDSFISWLESSGFRRSDLVWKPGEYAVRGGLVDCFDPSSKMPVRVSFFDDEVEDIRLFSPGDQITRYPSKSWSFGTVGGSTSKVRFPSFAERVIIFDPPRCRSNFDGFKWLWNDLSDRYSLDDDAWDDLLASASSLVLFEKVKGVGQTGVDVLEAPKFKGNLSILTSQVERWRDNGFDVLLRSSTRPAFVDGDLNWRDDPVTGGFVDFGGKTVVLSDVEIFGLSSAKKVGPGESPSDFDLFIEPGTWLVHRDHGLCRFAGTEVVHTGFGDQELLILSFHGSQKLMLPVTSMEKLSLYRGDTGDDLSPDVLGSVRWKNALKKAEKRIEEEAAELLDLYAKRHLASGRAFPKDEQLMAQFEDMFPYVETRDQMAAIDDVKRDMESCRPMDRLVVGDVGYGKTEVALRAAFKAVLGGAQVMIVVPTTVLAQQHYRSFCGRMCPFGVYVEQLSRFVPPKKQSEIVQRISEGKVDVVIGTHRLLQKDISMPGLGLIIVDEEHRFGVAHKVRLKGLRRVVDFLTLSATPIPRSLSMALKGIRDISTIETPPVNRPSVVTVTGPWDDTMVYKATAKELSRGGQVYFLHNRVESIYERAGWIKARFPHSEIAVAHGRMSEGELEDVMMSFYDGEVDVLVCTTIIESGLDVGRANTLIVDDSRTLGLAQMHQLRGRIGRREESAYAFFLYPSESQLPYRTGERLDAIGRMSFHGAGYEIARQDLSIRGGGDLLGFSQHGHRDRIGMELYYRKLKERIGHLKGAESATVKVEVRFPLMIPPGYIPQESIRMAIYRKIAYLNSKEDILSLRSELMDRFGPVPEEALCMIYMAVLRTEGSNQGIIHVVVDSETSKVTFSRSSGGVKPPSPWREKGSYWTGPGGRDGLISLIRSLFPWADGLAG
ncbi:MAG: helicase-related protein [Dethiosulfovibrio sp.]|nr:helicase-related protein [Dethiosulfovibrio sp.]